MSRFNNKNGETKKMGFQQKSASGVAKIASFRGWCAIDGHVLQHDRPHAQNGKSGTVVTPVLVKVPYHARDRKIKT